MQKDANESVVSNKQDVTFKMSNDFARSKMIGESVYEARIIACLASRIGVGDNDFEYHNLDVGDVIDQRTLLSDNTYELIQGACDNLVANNILAKAKYKDGVISARFFLPVMRPYLLQLNEGFTQIQLRTFIEIQDQYTQKLFTYLMSWKHMESISAKLEDLYDMFCFEGKSKNWDNLNSYVIEPGVEEINSLTGAKITYKPVQTDVETTHLLFDLSSGL